MREWFKTQRAVDKERRAFARAIEVTGPMTDAEIISKVREMRRMADEAYAEGQKMHNDGLEKMNEAATMRQDAEVLVRSLFLDQSAREALKRA